MVGRTGGGFGDQASAGALDYDAWFETRWGRYAYDLEACLVQTVLDVQDGWLVLDVGCGTGRTSVGVRGAVPPAVGSGRGGHASA